MNIFVGGSLRDVPRSPETCARFVADLGGEIVKREHTLLTGCRGSLDRAIAEAAHAVLVERELDPRRHLISYKLERDERAHQLGRIQISRLTDWELTHADLNAPEQIAEADVAVLVAGGSGTFLAANWARIAEKPVLGVKQFGGAGAQIFDRERDRFQQLYAEFVDAEDFDVLGRPVIVTAERGTELPFDLADVPVVFWESQEELKRELAQRVGRMVTDLRRFRQV